MSELIFWFSVIATYTIGMIIAYLWAYSVGYKDGIRDGTGIREHFVGKQPIREPKAILDMGPFGKVEIMPKEEKDGTARHEDQRENQKG